MTDSWACFCCIRLIESLRHVNIDFKDLQRKAPTYLQVEGGSHETEPNTDACRAG